MASGTHRRVGSAEGREREVIFRGSSMVEQPAVNRRVVGSNPTRGV